MEFLIKHKMHGFVVLGSVFLAVTGGEALYADMGHFGRKPIRLGWFYVVLPALLLNYFGQGALLMRDPAANVNPFYHMIPEWALYPMVGLATLAAVIASQALISGAFSLTRQAVQLGYLPRVEINHTSSDEIGQIYVPIINWALLIGTVWLVLEYKSSTHLAAAYGIAVATTMVITTVLTYFVAKDRWGWSSLHTLLVVGGFICIDLAFFGANFVKISQGGWLPLTVGVAVLTIMTTWRRGRFILANRLSTHAVSFSHFQKLIATTKPAIVPGTAVFMTGANSGTPPALVHNMKHNKVLHETIIILTVTTEAMPHVSKDNRMQIENLSPGFYKVDIHYGFMDSPNIPAALARCSSHGLDIRLAEITYFLGRETLVATKKPGMAMWRERLFSFMSRNAQRANTFFKLPTNQVVEIGMQIDL
jgi:KUP system potassium uptake protein